MLCRVALALSTTRGRAPIPTPKRPSIGDWPDERMPDKPLGPPVSGKPAGNVSTDDGENMPRGFVDGGFRHVEDIYGGAMKTSFSRLVHTASTEL